MYGKTGMGKSRWTKRYLKGKRRVLIVDPQLEHEGEAFDDMEQMLDRAESYPTFRAKTEFVQDVPMVARIAMVVNDKRRFEKGHPELVLVIEEAQRSLPSGSQNLPDSVEDVIYRGRHNRVTLVTVSQRPSTVHIAARSQWTRLVIFRQSESADLKWLSDQTGEDEEDFKNLAPGEFFEFTNLGGIKATLPDQREVTPIQPTSSVARTSAVKQESGHDTEDTQ